MAQRLGVAPKLYGAFAAMLVLIAALGVAGYLALSGAVGLLGQTQAGTTGATAALARQITELQIVAIAYRADRSVGGVADFAAALKATSLDDPAFADPAAKTSIDALRADLKAYAAGFDKAAARDTDGTKLLAAIRAKGDEATAAAATLIGDWASLLNARETARAAEANLNVQAAIAQMERYAGSGVAADLDAFNQRTSAASAALQAMASGPYASIATNAATANTALAGLAAEVPKL
jgi:hypothetical protein